MFLNGFVPLEDLPKNSQILTESDKQIIELKTANSVAINEMIPILAGLIIIGLIIVQLLLIYNTIIKYELTMIEYEINFLRKVQKKPKRTPRENTSMSEIFRDSIAINLPTPDICANNEIVLNSKEMFI